jgi:hypothetical protein
MGREVELFHPHLVITIINRSADIKNPALTRSKEKKHAFQREKGKYMDIFCLEPTAFSQDPRLLIRDPRLFSRDPRLFIRDPRLFTHDPRHSTHDC